MLLLLVVVAVVVGAWSLNDSQNMGFVTDVEVAVVVVMGERIPVVAVVATLEVVCEIGKKPTGATVSVGVCHISSSSFVYEERMMGTTLTLSVSKVSLIESPR